MSTNELETMNIHQESPPPSYAYVMSSNRDKPGYHGFPGLPPRRMDILNENSYNPDYSSFNPVQSIAPSGVETDPAVTDDSTGFISREETSQLAINDDDTPRTIDVLAGWCGFSCFYALFACIPISMLVIGVVNKKNCPMDANIPLFLMMSGGMATLLVIPGLAAVENTTTLGMVSKRVFVVGFLFLLGIQIWGSYVVFRRWSSWNTFYKHNPSDFCDTTTYLFSFSMLIIFWTLGPMVILAIFQIVWGDKDT